MFKIAITITSREFRADELHWYNIDRRKVDLVTKYMNPTNEWHECKFCFGAHLLRNVCEPLCTEGCQYGVCTLPDTCECNFGYVGANCTTECHCNKHSNCVSAIERNRCVHCYNNTIVSCATVVALIIVGTICMNLYNSSHNVSFVCT